MSKFTKAGMPQSIATRVAEGVAEAGLAVATAGFTAAVWLSIASVAATPAMPVASADAPVQTVARVTLPTVFIVGHREWPQPTPAVTTAENTAAFPVNLRQ